MLLRIIGLLLLIPLFDIVLLVFVATRLGALPTVVLVGDDLYAYASGSGSFRAVRSSGLRTTRISSGRS